MTRILTAFVVVSCGSLSRTNSSADPGGGRPDARRSSETGAVSCVVQADDNGVGACTDTAPPGSFDPDIQWTWSGQTETKSTVTPLVANLTDDNNDGNIDLCDIPDVIVVAYPLSSVSGQERVGHIYVLDGQDGTEELRITTDVDWSVTPAIGDLDHDGIAEVVSVDPSGRLWAFRHDGQVYFGPAGQWIGDQYASAIALADLDHDGNVEILAANTVFDNLGVMKWHADAAEALWNATTSADLDGDGTMEVVLGNAAYHADGTLYWQSSISAGYPAVANFDDDPFPEILVTGFAGISMLNHDGSVVFRNLQPTGDTSSWTTWARPATIHDFDGDGQVDFAMSSANHYSVYRADGTIAWSAEISDDSGIAAGTAFDFLGTGRAEAMYADETTLYIFGEQGQTLMSVPRSSQTLTEYPVVADVDNDGSAEIVVVSDGLGGSSASPTVQVVRDKQDRWIQARRIWNQHTYHVSNVREDGTIPMVEHPSWQQLNTFRTNAQLSGNHVCEPPIL